MGVYTNADAKKDSAAEHIKQAIQDIHDLTSPDTWGHEEYSEDFMNEMIKYEMELKLMLKKIK